MFWEPVGVDIKLDELGIVLVGSAGVDVLGFGCVRAKKMSVLAPEPLAGPFPDSTRALES
jgi:hypothetical protein